MTLYEQDLTLNNLHGLICHKTEPTNLSTARIQGIKNTPGKFMYLFVNSAMSILVSLTYVRQPV